MPESKPLVLDANILIRAVLGERVPSLLTQFRADAQFLAPQSAFDEAQKHLPRILGKRSLPLAVGLEALDSLRVVVQAVGSETYSAFEQAARMRLARRDPDDWPVLAAALALNCPIWTEDFDFFGVGVATWTTDRIELFFESTPAGQR